VFELFLFAIILVLIFLPDREPYESLIRKWTRPLKMKIVFHNRYSSVYNADVIDNVLYISRFNKAIHNEQEYLFSLAHEIGHLLDYAYKEHVLDEEELYNSLDNKKAIYADEVAAWKLAAMLLEDIDYNKQAFELLKNQCLKQYEDALKIKKGKKKNAKRSRSSNKEPS
jgi:hypothetical protein